MSPEELDLLTCERVSQLLTVPVTTLYQWRHRGVGPPAIKIGRYLRYPKSGLLEWLNSQPGAEDA